MVAAGWSHFPPTYHRAVNQLQTPLSALRWAHDLPWSFLVGVCLGKASMLLEFSCGTLAICCPTWKNTLELLNRICLKQLSKMTFLTFLLPLCVTEHLPPYPP